MRFIYEIIENNFDCNETFSYFVEMTPEQFEYVSKRIYSSTLCESNYKISNYKHSEDVINNCLTFNKFHDNKSYPRYSYLGILTDEGFEKIKQLTNTDDFLYLGNLEGFTTNRSN